MAEALQAQTTRIETIIETNIETTIETKRVRTKICGITRVEDAVLAAELGADAIGLVFYPQSKRCVSLQQAALIRAELPAFVTVVGLFVDPSAEAVREALDSVSLDCLQFHGDEDAAFCKSFRRPYMKALRVRSGVDVLSILQTYTDASAVLLDSYHPHLAGGTGERFDWQIARRCVEHGTGKVVLAGGLQADNIAEAILQVQPWALDVSSGVESEPGIKSREKMKAFFNEVYRVKS